jgi:hypothetical protein
LAELVVHEDYGWFTPADLIQVVRAIHRLADWKNVILVGGQSLTAWVQHYQIELPAFEGPFLTADADFLASKTDAQLIAQYLRGRARFPGYDDHTPNAAVIDFAGANGDLLHIDILGAVLGLKEADVRRLAVPVEIEGLEAEAVAVLHPLLVLQSRCVNLERLSEKRSANGVTQARVACLVVQKYLEDCLGNPARRRESLKAARRVCAIAQSRAGVFVYRNWGIDVLTVVDPTRMPGQFTRSWTYEVLRTGRKRVIAAQQGAH